MTGSVDSTRFVRNPNSAGAVLGGFDAPGATTAIHTVPSGATNMVEAPGRVIPMGLGSCGVTIADNAGISVWVPVTLPTSPYYGSLKRRQMLDSLKKFAPPFFGHQIPPYHS